MCKPAKDKAVHRFSIRNIVDSGAMNDLRAACAYESYTVPKLYAKNYYCISCAVHSRIVRVRNNEARKNRDPPTRFSRRRDADPDAPNTRRPGSDRRPERKGPAPAAAPEAAAPVAAAAE
jgi:small subunit ribosomal protein S26e